uniref:Uncharacterized protein n=1 Tax=Rhizophora mucronata TaxID=61149 RepID=A0A2P2PCS2_RHIMU
MVSSWVLNAL